MEFVVSFANLTLLVLMMVPVVFRVYLSEYVCRPVRVCPGTFHAARRRALLLRLPQKHDIPESHADFVL